MLKELWPLILLGAVGLSTIGIAIVIFYRKSSRNTSKLLLSLGFVSALLAVMSSLYTSFSSSDLTAYATCQTSSEYVPATVTCVADVSEPASIQWKINGKSIPNEGSTIQQSVEAPGKVTIELSAKDESFIRSSHASFATSIFLQEPKPTPPPIVTITRSFSEVSTSPRTFRAVFHPDPGYQIVGATLAVSNAENASDIRLEKSATEVVVQGALSPKLHVRGFKLQSKAAVASGLVTITQKIAK